jgi:hypothetical protein
MMKIRIQTILIACSLFVGGTVVNGLFNGGIFIQEVEARVGRPLTPVSVAGVAHPTTRRRIHRTTVYVVTLPPQCSTVVVEGATLHLCGGTYYQPYNNQYVVVNVE